MEIFILMPDDIAKNETRQGICSNRNDSNQIQTLNDTHRSYDPLAYPLFSRGTDGFHLGLTNNENRRLTLLQYLAYQMRPRIKPFNVLHARNKLLQQFIADQFCKVKSQFKSQKCDLSKTIKDNSEPINIEEL